MTFATGVISGIAGVLVSIPFLRSFNVPGFKTRDYLDIKIPKLNEGELTVVPWLGKPLYIYKRTKLQMLALGNPDHRLLDPESVYSDQPEFAVNNNRSLNPEIFVAWGICTHLGCAVAYNPGSAFFSGEKNRPGRFLCPCHSSVYDLSGRVFENMPAPKNLAIPVYEFLDESTIRVPTEGNI